MPNASYPHPDDPHSPPRYTEGPTRAAMKKSLIVGLAWGYSHAVLFLFYALSWWWAGKLLSKGEITISNVFRSFFAVLLANVGLMQAMLGFPDVAKSRGAVQRIFSTIDRSPPIQSYDPTGEQPDEVRGAERSLAWCRRMRPDAYGRFHRLCLTNWRYRVLGTRYGGGVGARLGGVTRGSERDVSDYPQVRGEIVLRNVDFSYPTRPHVKVFNNFSLVIPAGKQTAMVGQSGSGKSTVVALVLR